MRNSCAEDGREQDNKTKARKKIREKGFAHTEEGCARERGRAGDSEVWKGRARVQKGESK